MPNVYYSHATGTQSDIKAIEKFERFLDDSHAEISQNIHEQLLEIHSGIDEEVTEKFEEFQQKIDELEARISELEQQLEDAE